jgi:cytochrome c5
VKVKVLALLIAASGLFIAGSIAQETADDIAERIKPVGKVNIAGAAAACTACHAVGVLGAPKTQVAADWQPRLDEKGFDTVWKNAIDGINAMPPMGTCGDCTNDDIKAAIEYMIEGI